MTSEQQSSNKKTWAELAEEEDDEIENGQFTTNSETLDKNEIPSQPTLTKSISEFQSKKRNDRQKNTKQRDQGNNGLKNYRQNNSYQNKGNNKQNRQNKNHYDDIFNALFETQNQEILLRIRPQNRNDNLDAVKEFFEKQYQTIKAFLRNDINQIDLLITPKIGLLILEDHKFKTQICDSNVQILYPQFPNEPLPEYYEKKKYLEKEKKLIQVAAPVFQRSSINSKVSQQQDFYEKSDNDSKQDIGNFEQDQKDQSQIYKQKDNLEDFEQEENKLQKKQNYEKKDLNKQSNYKSRKYNNNYNESQNYQEDLREYDEDKQSNYKSYQYRNEQYQTKDNYQHQKYYSNDDCQYTQKSSSDKYIQPYEEKESNKDYRNNQNYNNHNNNNHYNQKRSYKGNTKQKSDQYVIYEIKQKSNYDEQNDNLPINNDDNYEEKNQVPQNINQAFQQSNYYEEKNEDIQIDSENEQGQEQIEENKSPNKNKKKKKNKKNQKTLKPNDTNFFGILQSVAK